jgi:hypothetical protein
MLNFNSQEEPPRISSIPRFVDLEASSLRSNSYPIEVAWSLPDETIESYLVSPAGIESWTDWSIESQEIHGIRRGELLENGKQLGWICKRMNEQLAGQVVYTDNPSWDGTWLAELFHAAEGSLMEFSLGSVDELLFSDTYSDAAARAFAMVRVEELKRKARERAGGQHRAAVDVQYLIELWKLANSYVE